MSARTGSAEPMTVDEALLVADGLGLPGAAISGESTKRALDRLAEEVRRQHAELCALSESELRCGINLQLREIERLRDQLAAALRDAERCRADVAAAHDVIERLRGNRQGNRGTR
ncbi:MAG: hypothetical protein RL375_1053 [Pseudomonadota bacterium]|jgi:serine/threonine protein phosphatase PrpC